MTCSCCGALGNEAIISILVTAFVVFSSGKLLPHGIARKVIRFITGALSFILILLAVFLATLSSYPSLSARWFAFMCKKLSEPSELDNYRCPLVASATGATLELGPGAGANFRCLVNSTSITSYQTVEPNDSFTNDLLEEAKSHKLPFDVTPTWLRGEDLDIPDSSIDTVLATHVLCSVDDPVMVLDNIDKALKRGGTFVNMEHVTAPEDQGKLRLAQSLIQPVATILFNGCKFRDAETIIRETLGDRYDINVTKFDAPMPLVPFVPHVSVIATKR